MKTTVPSDSHYHHHHPADGSAGVGPGRPAGTRWRPRALFAPRSSHGALLTTYLVDRLPGAGSFRQPPMQTALAAAAGADHCLRLQLRRPCLACGAQSFAPQGHTYTQRRTWPWKRRSGWLASACTYVMAPPVVAARTRGIRHRRPLFRQRARGRGRGARRPASSGAARPPSYSDAACRWPAGGQRFWFCSPIEQSLAARGGIDQNGDRPEILSNGTEPRAPHVAARRPAAPVLSLARASERARRRV
jgi:hypothetical protein